MNQSNSKVNKPTKVVKINVSRPKQSNRPAPRVIQSNVRRNNYSTVVPQPRIPSQFPKGSTTNAKSKLVDIVEFDEYIGEVNGSVNFIATKYAINPGLSATFPEGSVEAALWTEWMMKYCVFYYKPEVSGFATQGQSGKIILACDYNAANASPTTKAQVEIMHKADGMPYEDIRLKLDPGYVNRSDSKYIRVGARPSNTDIKTYDGGNLWVSTYGQANTNVCGELRCHYAFTVSKPTLLNSPPAADPNVAYFQSTTQEAAAATGVLKQLVLATATNNGLGVVNTAGSMVPPPGNYLIDAYVTCISNGNVGSSCVLDIQKNGVSLLKLTPSYAIALSTGYFSQFPLTVSTFVQCNGTDAITMLASIDYASSTGDNSGSIIFTAV